MSEGVFELPGLKSTEQWVGRSSSNGAWARGWRTRWPGVGATVPLGCNPATTSHNPHSRRNVRRRVPKRKMRHVLFAILAGGKSGAREFHAELVGLTEVPKPTNLADRCGLWFN